MELLAPRPGERILDLGCGDGALTETLVAAGCRVVGVDGSAEQIAAAESRGLDARIARAELIWKSLSSYFICFRRHPVSTSCVLMRKFSR